MTMKRFGPGAPSSRGGPASGSESLLDSSMSLSARLLPAYSTTFRNSFSENSDISEFFGLQKSALRFCPTVLPITEAMHNRYLAVWFIDTAATGIEYAFR